MGTSRPVLNIYRRNIITGKTSLFFSADYVQCQLKGNIGANLDWPPINQLRMPSSLAGENYI